MKMASLLIFINFMMMMMTLSQKLVSMGGILLSSATMITMLIAFLSNSWYAFILFLIYITGLLVLFSYFLALSPNTYQTEKKFFKSYILMIPMLIIPPFYISNMPTFKIKFENDAMSLIMNNLSIYWLMVIFLLITLLMVVSLVYKSPSPLRKYLK